VVHTNLQCAADGAGSRKQLPLVLWSAAKRHELHGGLPIRIKVILEGDEETGSRPLPQFVSANLEMLRADLCCYSDGPMFPNDQPVLLMGVRGVLGLEFAATGAKRNLHSGNFGQLGYGNTLNIGNDELPSSVGVVQVGAAVATLTESTAQFHVCVLTTANNIRCWGNGADGRLGYGNVDNVGNNEVPSFVGDVPY